MAVIALICSKIACINLGLNVCLWQLVGLEKIMSNSEDEDLFKKYMEGVEPLARRHTRVSKVTKSSNTKKGTVSNYSLSLRRQSAVCDSGSGYGDSAGLSDAVELIAPDEKIEYLKHGALKTDLELMRRGDLDIESVLDLHGYSIDRARFELTRFIDECCKCRYQYVKIIHGKSRRTFEIANDDWSLKKATLKSLINGWLRQLEGVCAFTSCISKHGGTGAVYVMLDCD